MKIKITEELAVGHEHGTYLLVNQEGDIEAYSGNTDFNDLGNEVPKGEYLVLKSIENNDETQLGGDLEVIGIQNHLSKFEVQEYEFGNMPTNLEIPHFDCCNAPQDLGHMYGCPNSTENK